MIGRRAWHESVPAAGARFAWLEGRNLAIQAWLPAPLRDEADFMWRYRIGRLLQFLALLILPFAIASELVGQFGLGQSLLVAAGGAALFYVGFLIQHRA